MQYILPKLQNDNDFEDLVKDIYSFEFKNPNLQRYGRNGQAQDGIDIVGIAGTNHATGRPTVIQCKNHTVHIADSALINEIDTEVAKFDGSTFKSNDYLFVTSADNSKPVIDHCREITEMRLKAGKPAVDIRFWDLISEKAFGSRQILHKYYSAKFSFLPPDNLILPDSGIKYRKTVRIRLGDLTDDSKLDEIKKAVLANCRLNLGFPESTADPYKAYLGITSNPRTTFDGQVDLEIDLSDVTDGIADLEGRYDRFRQNLIRLVGLLRDPFYSNEIFVMSDTEVNLAFMIGRLLRRSGYSLNATFKNMLFSSASNELAPVPSGIQEKFIQSHNGSAVAEDSVFIFSSALGTNITDDVVRYTDAWGKPTLLRSYYISDGKIASSAHAAVVTADICAKMHNLQFQGVKHIHVFIAAPKPLAMLLGYGLNTLNTQLHLYFMAPDRTGYLCTGVIDNNTFGGL